MYSSYRPTTAEQQQRPTTAASVACSSISSMSCGSSCNGSELAALVQRRSQIRAQMHRVDSQLRQVQTPPMTASSSSSAHPYGAGAYDGAVPRAAPRHGSRPRCGAARHGCLLDETRPPTCSSNCGAKQPSCYSLPAAALATPPNPSQSHLPGALAEGRYAFWPKTLKAGRGPGDARKVSVLPPRAATADGGTRPVASRGAAAARGRTCGARPASCKAGVLPVFPAGPLSGAHCAPALG